MNKTLSYLIATTLFSLSLGTIGCQSKMVTTDYDSSKKVQIIPVTDKSTLIVQNDRLVDEDSLYNGMSKESENVAIPAADAKKYKKISAVTLNLQLITLVGCLVATPLQPVMLWCGSSIAFGVFGSIPYAQKADNKKLEAATQHNESLSQTKKSNVTLH